MSNFTHKIQGVVNKDAARRDYLTIGALALHLGLEVPPIGMEWGWRRIDKVIAGLKEAVNDKMGWQIEWVYDLVSKEVKPGTEAARAALAEAVKLVVAAQNGKDKTLRVVKKEEMPGTKEAKP